MCWSKHTTFWTVEILQQQIRSIRFLVLFTRNWTITCERAWKTQPGNAVRSFVHSVVVVRLFCSFTKLLPLERCVKEKRDSVFFALFDLNHQSNSSDNALYQGGSRSSKMMYYLAIVSGLGRKIWMAWMDYCHGDCEVITMSWLSRRRIISYPILKAKGLSTGFGYVRSLSQMT